MNNDDNDDSDSVLIMINNFPLLKDQVHNLEVELKNIIERINIHSEVVSNNLKLILNLSDTNEVFLNKKSEEFKNIQFQVKIIKIGLFVVSVTQLIIAWIA